MMDEKEFYLEWISVFLKEEEQDAIFKDLYKNCE